MKKVLTQIGTLNSLMMGEYHATETVGELLKKGDIVIGTEEGVDGEAIILNGVASASRGDVNTYARDSEDTLQCATTGNS